MDAVNLSNAVKPEDLAERLRGELQDYWVHLQAASSLEKYPAKQHAQRVAARLGVSQGLIYLPGAPLAYLEDSDQPQPFRQRRYFYYLSGVDEASCHLTYDIQRDCLALYIPKINARRVIWNGRGSTMAEAFDKYDVDEVHYTDKLETFVLQWPARNHGTVYILHPSQEVTPGQSKLQRVDYTKLRRAVDEARVIKDSHEIELIKQANEITAKAHRKVLSNIKKFKNEAQVEAVFLDACVSEEAKHQAYEIIAASGENASVLHYVKNDESLNGRQLMCLDAGCEWQCYASDVTRTFPLSGTWPSKEAKQIYDLVQEMQTQCISHLKPGVRFLDLHVLAHKIAVKGLLDLGILHNGTAEQILTAGTTLAFFPHGLGHHLGLEVHDVSGVPLMQSSKDDDSDSAAPSPLPSGVQGIKNLNHNPTQLFVSNLTFRVADEWLKEEFNEFGGVLNCKIVRGQDGVTSKGFAYIDFASHDSARRALAAKNGAILDGRPLFVDFAAMASGRKAENPKGDYEVIQDLQGLDLESLYPRLAHPEECKAPVDVKSKGLEEGMVVTVEPGIYFNHYGLRKMFLSSPLHARFINKALLERYYPIGGVRIEDDILITANGYENLTTAPKGEEMLQVIAGEVKAEESESENNPSNSAANETAQILRQLQQLDARIDAVAKYMAMKEEVSLVEQAIAKLNFLDHASHLKTMMEMYNNRPKDIRYVLRSLQTHNDPKPEDVDNLIFRLDNTKAQLEEKVASTMPCENLYLIIANLREACIVWQKVAKASEDFKGLLEKKSQASSQLRQPKKAPAIFDPLTTLNGGLPTGHSQNAERMPVETSNNPYRQGWVDLSHIYPASGPSVPQPVTAYQTAPTPEPVTATTKGSSIYSAQDMTTWQSGVWHSNFSLPPDPVPSAMPSTHPPATSTAHVVEQPLVSANGVVKECQASTVVQPPPPPQKLPELPPKPLSYRHSLPNLQDLARRQDAYYRNASRDSELPQEDTPKYHFPCRLTDIAEESVPTQFPSQPASELPRASAFPQPGGLSRSSSSPYSVAGPVNFGPRTPIASIPSLTPSVPQPIVPKMNSQSDRVAQNAHRDTGGPSVSANTILSKLEPSLKRCNECIRRKLPCSGPILDGKCSVCTTYSLTCASAFGCTYCRMRKIRCSGADKSDDGRCQNCISFSQPWCSSQEYYRPRENLESVDPTSMASVNMPGAFPREQQRNSVAGPSPLYKEFERWYQAQRFDGPSGS